MYCSKLMCYLLPMPDLHSLPPQRLWVERFWNKVDKTSTCWLWTGSTNPLGYGSIRIQYVLYKAHRISYYMAYGSIPAGMEIDHTCCNPSCVRPDHLEAVTHAENMRRYRTRAGIKAKPYVERGNAQTKKRFCPHGHEYTPDNTGRQRKPDGTYARYCRTCRRAQWHAWRSKTNYGRLDYTRVSDQGE